PGRTREPGLTGSRVTVTLGKGALAATRILLADRTIPCTVMAFRSTCQRTVAVIAVAGGAAERDATCCGDSTKATVARPTTDIARMPAARPPGKSFLLLSGSAAGPPAPARGPPATSTPPPPPARHPGPPHTGRDPGAA